MAVEWHRMGSAENGEIVFPQEGGPLRPLVCYCWRHLANRDFSSQAMQAVPVSSPMSVLWWAYSTLHACCDHSPYPTAEVCRGGPDDGFQALLPNTPDRD